VAWCGVRGFLARADSFDDVIYAAVESVLFRDCNSLAILHDGDMPIDGQSAAHHTEEMTMAEKPWVCEQFAGAEDTLPNTLWELLEVALNDLAAVEQDPHYEVHMGVWHDGGIAAPGACGVCLAGAVMAKRLHISPSVFITPSHFDASTLRDKLLSIDYLREGLVPAAAESLYGTALVPGLPKSRVTPSYHNLYEDWYAAMHKLLAELKTAGV
jgi:hypothetical protein